MFVIILESCLLNHNTVMKGNLKLGFIDALLEKTMRAN